VKKTPCTEGGEKRKWGLKGRGGGGGQSITLPKYWTRSGAGNLGRSRLNERNRLSIPSREEGLGGGEGKLKPLATMRKNGKELRERKWGAREGKCTGSPC